MVSRSHARKCPHLGQLDRIELERAREIAAANVERYLELQGTSLP
jgi:hypothetical protein